MKKHPIVTINKNSFPLSIFKTKNHSNLLNGLVILRRLSLLSRKLKIHITVVTVGDSKSSNCGNQS